MQLLNLSLRVEISLDSFLSDLQLGDAIFYGKHVVRVHRVEYCFLIALEDCFDKQLRLRAQEILSLLTSLHIFVLELEDLLVQLGLLLLSISLSLDSFRCAVLKHLLAQDGHIVVLCEHVVYLVDAELKRQVERLVDLAEQCYQVFLALHDVASAVRSGVQAGSARLKQMRGDLTGLSSFRVVHSHSSLNFYVLLLFTS